ncbi:MAG TPA: TlpA disulfide reductase family protein [Thermodesulfobacteriota bacterium]|nr:TlpA disulfide reductase family protein [Thermodesulfobacteriota bacterium]
MKRTFLICFLIFSFCVGSVFFLFGCSKGEKDPFSASASDFSLKSFDGQEITLSQLKGKVVLLDFWATWCGPCRESIPHLIQLYKNYREKGFEVVGMNIDKGDGEAVRRFVKSMDIPYPVVIAPEDLVRKYQVTGIPASFLIDKQGKIREKMVGFSSAIARQLDVKVGDLTSENP